MKVASRIVGGFILALALGACGGGAAPDSDGEVAYRISTGSGVRMRSAPRKDAEIVASLGLGQQVSVEGRSESQSTIGGTTAYWYDVMQNDGARGWVFGALTAPLEGDRTYIELARKRFERKANQFSDWRELYDYTVQAAGQSVKDQDVRAELDAFSDVALGCKISGAGGGGYAVFFSEEPIPEAIRPKIRVED